MTKKPSRLRNSIIGLAALAAVAGTAVSYSVYAKPAAPFAPHVVLPNAGKVAAVVNGQDIFDSELSGGIAQGVDRAVVIDRYINKALAADLARTAYAKDAAEALKGAEREVLSQLFIARKTEELRAGVTPEAVKTYYDTYVKAEDFAGYKVKFMVSPDEKEASEAVAAIAAGRARDLDARFKPVKEGAEPFALAQELPYGLGSVVRGLKKGEYSRPVVMRNGYFILLLEDVKVNPKPDIAAVTEEIKNVLVAKGLTDTLANARQAAKVELR